MPKNPPEDIPRITPYLVYRNVDAALDWLERAFGFKTRFSMPKPDGSLMYAEMGFFDGIIMIGPPNPEERAMSPADLGGVHQSLYVYVDDVKAHCEHARASGASILMEPEEMFWGDLIYATADLEGHQWSFAQHIRDVAPEDVMPPQR